MKKSLKAALLSGLAFPGAGYFVVQRPMRGVVFVLLSAACLVRLVTSAVEQALTLTDKILAGEVPLDANGVANLVANSSATSGTTMLSIASWVLLICWILSVVDGYRIGLQEDQKALPKDGADAPVSPLRQRSAAPHVRSTAHVAAVATTLTTPGTAVKARVRVAHTGELPQLLQLYRHLHPQDPALPATEIVDAAWRAMLGNPSMRILVAVADSAAGETVVATATLLIIPNLTRGVRPYALIENVVTDPGWRQRGIATQVLQAAQQIAWGTNCYKVMLMTGRKDEATLRFYRGAGFIDGDKTAFVARPA